MSEEKKIIRYDSNEAAQLKTITGWVSSEGRFYGIGKDAEHMARWGGCTHTKCSTEGCNNWGNKSYTVCEDCRFKNAVDRYFDLPYLEYKPDMVVYSEDHDKYFFDSGEIEDFINDYDGVERIKKLLLLICEKVDLPIIDYDDMCNDVCHEDYEVDDEIIKKVEELNSLIKKSSSNTWFPSKQRTTYTHKDGNN